MVDTLSHQGASAGTAIAIENGIVLAAPGEDALLPSGSVVIDGDRIAWVGPASQQPSLPDGALRIDAAGCAVLPGMVNTHAHFRGFRALGDGLGFMEWHDRYVHRFAAQMAGDDAYYGALNTFCEMIRAGITFMQGMSSVTVIEDGEVQAAVDSGIRARLVPHIHERGEIEATSARIEAEQAGGAGDRVRTWLGVEVPQLVEPDAMRFLAAESDRLGVPVHTHFSEVSRDDINWFVDTGLFRRGLNLAHCVHLVDGDIAAFARSGVSVAHNPRSNARYGNGVAPLRAILDAGVVVGLGTDAPDSTFACDLLAEARAAALFARAVGRDPLALSAGDALRLATSGGAEALGMAPEIGRLRAGAKADVVVVDLTSPATTPVIVEGPHTNVEPLLVFGAVGKDVRDVVIDGQVVLRDGSFTFIDETAVARECQSRAERILAALD